MSTSILFIQTGGTIDKDYPREEQGWAFEITDPAVERILKKLQPGFDYKLVSLSKKDSLEITEEDRAELRAFIKDAAAERIVITHGTDTLLKTAESLKGLEGKTIAIVGARLPEKFSDSDAATQVGIAIGVAQIGNPGVYSVVKGIVTRM